MSVGISSCITSYVVFGILEFFDFLFCVPLCCSYGLWSVLLLCFFPVDVPSHTWGPTRNVQVSTYFLGFHTIYFVLYHFNVALI